ncbi:hypothetical protein DMC47_13245 [Nostoc sp. 3335mG]|nr:hypothetical protein DMC47_13245 [Nostoc sp. 3335mG]
MSREKTSDKDDLFRRGVRLRARQDADAREMNQDAGRARTEEFFQALVAAVAVIAHADGRLDMAERRKLVEAFIASPAMKGFSVAELAQELADHGRAYGYDPDAADRRALSRLSTCILSHEERRSIRRTCHDVITADGLVHPVELGALHRVERALGMEEST